MVLVPDLPQWFNWAEGNPAILPGEKYPQRIRWVNGHVIPLHPDECEPHTPMPDGYLAWHEWAERMSKTHDQRQCKGCGLWAVWEPGQGTEVGKNVWPDHGTAENTP